MLSAKNIAIVNTSPIIYLPAINQINLLNFFLFQMADYCVVPPYVKKDVEPNVLCA